MAQFQCSATFAQMRQLRRRKVGTFDLTFQLRHVGIERNRSVTESRIVAKNSRTRISGLVLQKSVHMKPSSLRLHQMVGTVYAETTAQYCTTFPAVLLTKGFQRPVPHLVVNCLDFACDTRLVLGFLSAIIFHHEAGKALLTCFLPRAHLTHQRE